MTHFPYICSPSAQHTLCSQRLLRLIFRVFPLVSEDFGAELKRALNQNLLQPFGNCILALWLYQALSTSGNKPPLLYLQTTEGGRAPLYTTEQIMHALNLLYFLLVILRTSQAPVCLNRIWSNPLEHLFGRGRVRSRYVNTIQRFVTVLGSDFLNMKSNVILDLVSISRHHTVLGVNCEAYASSLPSTFNQHPLDIAVFILRLVGLPVEKVCQTANVPEVVFRCELAGSQLASIPWLDRERQSGPEEDEYPDQVADQDEARTLEYLREVFMMLRAGSTTGKPYSPMNTERKRCVKTLSTRQVFLGVYHSHMRDSLLR
jgi:hypothetical protein